MEILKSDLERCKTAIQKLFLKIKGFELNNEQLTEITKDIISISESHGGGLSTDIIIGFAKGYIDSQLYLKYIDKEQFRFVLLIDDAKHDIKNYLEHPEMMPGYMLKKQLEMIIRELNIMVEDKGRGTFYPYYPKGITDSWDYNDTLGKKLMQIVNIYLKLRIKARQN